MAKKVELFKIGLSKDGTRMVAKLDAEKLVATNYKGEEFALEKGDYLDVADFAELMESANFLLEKEYIDQEVYDKKVAYLEMIQENFRAQVSIRAK